MEGHEWYPCQPQLSFTIPRPPPMSCGPEGSPPSPHQAGLHGFPPLPPPQLLQQEVSSYHSLFLGFCALFFIFYLWPFLLPPLLQLLQREVLGVLCLVSLLCSCSLSASQILLQELNARYPYSFAFRWLVLFSCLTVPLTSS